MAHSSSQVAFSDGVEVAEWFQELDDSGTEARSAIPVAPLGGALDSYIDKSILAQAYLAEKRKRKMNGFS